MIRKQYRYSSAWLYRCEFLLLTRALRHDQGNLVVPHFAFFGVFLSFPAFFA